MLLLRLKTRGLHKQSYQHCWGNPQPTSKQSKFLFRKHPKINKTQTRACRGDKVWIAFKKLNRPSSREKIICEAATQEAVEKRWSFLWLPLLRGCKTVMEICQPPQGFSMQTATGDPSFLSTKSTRGEFSAIYASAASEWSKWVDCLPERVDSTAAGWIKLNKWKHRHQIWHGLPSIFEYQLLWFSRFQATGDRILNFELKHTSSDRSCGDWSLF